MSYLKFKADHLFTGTTLLDHTHVLITNEQGIIETIVAEKDAGSDIRTFSGILSPGFINAHCHLELSHMKGLIPEKTGLIDFVFSIVTQRHFPEEEILDAIEKAEDEMLAGGIVAVGDICNNTSTLRQKSKKRLAYYNFIETTGWLPQIAGQRFDRSLSCFNSFNSQDLLSDLYKNVIVPHAPYSVSNDLWNLIAPNFKGNSVTIHNQETAFENDLFLNGTGDFTRMYDMMKLDNSFFKPTGKSSLQSYIPYLDHAERVILVHNTFSNEEDLHYINFRSEQLKKQYYYCLCVNANTYIENTIPPVALLRQHSSNIIIGTDSLASNHGLSILDEVKKISYHFPQIPMIELLRWATLNGANALQMQEQLGSFDKNKKPGIVLIDHCESGMITELSTAKLLL